MDASGTSGDIDVRCVQLLPPRAWTATWGGEVVARIEELPEDECIREGYGSIDAIRSSKVGSVNPYSPGETHGSEVCRPCRLYIHAGPEASDRPLHTGSYEAAIDRMIVALTGAVKVHYQTYGHKPLYAVPGKALDDAIREGEAADRAAEEEYEADDEEGEGDDPRADFERVRHGDSER